MLKIKDLKKLLDYYETNCPEMMDDEVVIIVTNDKDNVSSPTVSVKSADFGFDFNNGKFLIQPIEDLTIKQIKKKTK